MAYVKAIVVASAQQGISIRDVEVARSNRVAPTILHWEPFGERVERLSLCGDETYVAQSAVQTHSVEDLPASGGV
jgi:hypothetical protein